MNYNEIIKSVGKSKVAKIFGWIFLVFGLLALIIELPTYLSWKVKEKDYDKQYVYSDYGNLYYEMNDDIIYVEKIYDTSDEIIELDVPKQKTVIMYCSKNNIDECIYFDLNNSLDQGRLNPFSSIVSILFLISLGIFFVINTRDKKDEQNKGKTSLSSIYLGFVCLFVLGAGGLIGQIYNVVNYFSWKNDNNVVTATIYSEIYSTGGENDLYKPVSSYYVDNQKYIFVDDLYIDGYLEENLGKTFELYYNKNNPGEAVKKENPVNYKMIILAIMLIVVSFPIVFFKKQLEKRLDKDSEKQVNYEWEI